MEKSYERLTRPQVRENGALHPATWEQALDRAAAGFQQVIDMYGGQSFGMFSCSKTTNEMNFMAQKFARPVMGSNKAAAARRFRLTADGTPWPRHRPRRTTSSATPTSLSL